MNNKTEADHVTRILAIAREFNEAVADAQRDNLIVDFAAQQAGSGYDRAADRILVRSIYKSLHTHPTPRAGEDF